MLDLLAAIVSADPPAILAWLVLAFAAGMYPVGIMLGSSCSPCCGAPCCGAPCSQCTEGELPETITVSITGYENDQVPGPQLATLTFQSNFGDGAAGKVTAPVGVPGPISAVELTAGGSGYARVARVQPTITAEADGGTGAQLDITLVEIESEGRSAWAVESLDITDGGSGYTPAGQVTFSIAAGDTEVVAASAQYSCGRIEPAVTLSVGGAGAGAVISPTLAYYASEDFWYVSGVVVADGGSGYSDGDPVSVTVTDGDSLGVPFAMTVTVAGGVVTGVTVDNPYPYYAPWNRGSFAKNDGIIKAIDWLYGGIYYRDDPSLPGEKATVTVGVSQLGPPGVAASGAVLIAVIDDDAGSATFGQITSITIEDGGDGYAAYLYEPEKCCADSWNGLTVVLRRINSDPCVYVKRICSAACVNDISVVYRGPFEYPYLASSPAFGATGGCLLNLTGQTLIENCSAFSFTATDGNATATVTAGGEFDEKDKYEELQSGACFTCCRGEETPPEEVEVEVAQWNHDTESWVSPVDPTSQTLPVVVLQRPRPQGYPDIGCASVWSLDPGFGYSVSVGIEECSDRLAKDCFHCPTKCQTFAAVQTAGGKCVSFKYDPIVLQGGPLIRESCNCVERPVCAPSSGAYVVDTYALGSIWQINTACGTPFGPALIVRVTVL